MDKFIILIQANLTARCGRNTGYAGTPGSIIPHGFTTHPRLSFQHYVRVPLVKQTGISYKGLG